MSKPIKLTDELKEMALAEFEKTLNALKMTDGKISYSKNFTYKKDEKAMIYFAPLAYAKMVGLITSFDSEVAWHGVGERLEGANFLISDILVYPQTVTGSNVDMDTEAYAKWLMQNDDDERFNQIIMQGHSHVNFGTTPSTVDLNHQDGILSQLTDDMFYIFMIWNKKLEHTTKIYDLKFNTLYEDKDISYSITDGNELDGFVEEAKKQVKKKPAAPVGGNSYSGYGYYGGYGRSAYNGTESGHQSKKSAGKNKQKQKEFSKVGSGWCGRGAEDMDDEAYDYYTRDRFDT